MHNRGILKGLFTPMNTS